MYHRQRVQHPSSSQSSVDDMDHALFVTIFSCSENRTEKQSMGKMCVSHSRMFECVALDIFNGKSIVDGITGKDGNETGVGTELPGNPLSSP